MKRRRRLLLFFLLFLPLVLAGGLAAAVLLLPTERIAALASERAEAVLEREVNIGRISIDLFPTPAVALEGVVVGGATPDAPPFATVRRVVLRPRLLPLFARKVVIDAVVLDHPRMLINVSSSAALDRRVSEEVAAPAEAGGSAAFLIRRFEIQDGRIAYRDRKTGNVVRLDGVEQRLRLSGQIQNGELARIALEGTLAMDSLGATLPGALAVPLHGLPLRIEHDAFLDLAGDSLVLERLALDVLGLALEGTGAVRQLTATDAREVSLRLGAAPFDVAGLLRSLPPGLIPALDSAGGRAALPALSGSASIAAVVTGRLGADTVPDVRGRITLEDIGVALADADELIRDLGGDIAFSFDSVASSQLLGRLAGQPLELAFAVHDPAAPAIRLNIRTLVDLDQAAALGLLPDSLAAQGRLGVDLAVRAPVLAPARGTVDGTVQFDGMTVTTPALEQPVAIEGGRLVFDGQRVRGEELQIQAGESDLALDLTVNDWLPFALGDSTAVASASFDARSRLLDLDALLGTPDSALYSKLFFARLADRPVDGRPVDEIAEEAGLGLPPLPPIRLDGRLRAYTLRRNGLELQDVDVRVAGRGDRIELTDARFNLMGGGVQVSGRIGIPAGTPADGEAGFPTVLTYQLRDVGAAPFFNTLTPFRDHLTGSLLMGGTARMVLDEYLLPRRESLTAEGTLAVNGGQLANWTVLSALAERLGLPQFDTLTFHDWTGGFQVAGPQIALTESVIASDEVQVRTAGSFDFAGRLNLTATLLLDPAVAERMRADVASRLTGAVAGPEGRIPLGVRITGPATEPELALDFSRAAENALAKARAEAQERVEAAAAKALDGAVEQLLPQRDSLSTAADSARARVEKEVKSRLCKIIKCD